MISPPFKTVFAAAFITFFSFATSDAPAAELRLADYAYAGHHLDDRVVVIDSTGAAKLAISLISPTMARVRIAPTGGFTPNPSPAVAPPPAALAETRVEDRQDYLLIRSTGLALRIDKHHLRVDAYDSGNDKPLSLESTADGTAWDAVTGEIHQSRQLDDAEHLYGLGQDNANRGTLDRRGAECDLWTGQQIRSGNVTAEDPIPFYLSSGIDGRGYGCFVDNVWRMKFDLGRRHKDRLTWSAPGGPIDYYLIAGPSFKSIIGQYTQLTGRPSMLPLWALGFWQSRCFYWTFEEVMGAADRLRSGGLPVDVMVIDANWPSIPQDFRWGKTWLQSGRKPEEWLADFHAKGLHVVQSNSGPMIKPEAENYADGWSKGLFATDGHGNPLTCGYYGGHLMDFTHPKMNDWLWPQLATLTTQGIDGWWLDLIEPEGEPPQAVYYAGKSADIHNTFPLRCFQSYFGYERSHAPQGRPVILGRAASAGTQRFGAIVWSGDIHPDWPTLQAHLPELQNAGLSGLSWWTNDSGGFLSGFLDDDRFGAHARLYERWFEFSCFLPITRAHKSGLSEPFQYGPEVEATCKKYLQLRYRLLPYIYGLAHDAATTGLPIVRPLVLEYQSDPGSANTRSQFLLGSDLLVAPVVWEHATARQVYFPPGKWISLEDGYEVDGGQTIGVSAPRDRIPLFVKAGAILPMAPDMTHTEEKPWDPVTLEIWPAEDSTATLYQDDNATTAFTHGESTTTSFHCSERPGSHISFDVTPSNAKFGPAVWIGHFHLTSAPVSLELDGKALPKAGATNSAAGWTWDEPQNLLTVTFPGGRAARSLKIVLDGSSRPRAAAPKVDVPTLENGAPRPPQQLAEFLPPPVLPNRIEAANFDKGGPDLAYHVQTEGNPDHLYRSEGVPITTSTDAGGGYAVGPLAQGDWLAYTIDAGDGGWFAASARLRTDTRDAALSLRRNRGYPLTAFDIPPVENGGARWVTVGGSKLFYLPPGQQFVSFRAEQPSFLFANATFTKAGKTGTAVQAATGKTLGGAGIEKSEPGGTPNVRIGGKDDGLRIRVDSPVAGRALVALRYAVESDAAKIAISCGGAERTTTLAATGAWSNFDQAGEMLDLKGGMNEIEIRGTGEGSALISELRVVAP